MTQINDRKEPTFGTPNGNNNPTSINSEKNVEMAKVNLSIHSDKTPNYTFTPIMKSPVSTVEQRPTEEKTLQLQEQSMLTDSEPAVSKVSRGFSFTPVREDGAVEVNHEQIQRDTPSSIDSEPGIPNFSDTITPETAERVIPTAKIDEKTEKIPSKYRRLSIVLLLLLSLIIVFFLLKPQMPDAVQSLQEQGSSLPIEFRPVDEAEAKRAEEQAKALQAAQDAEKQAVENVANTSQNVITDKNEALNASVKTKATVSPQLVAEEDIATPNQNAVVTTELEKPVEQKQLVVAPVKKIESVQSVIYQPEVAKKANVEKPKPAPQPKVEKVVEKATEKVAVKPQTQSKPVEVKSVASSSSKVLTVPKGVSLMQVFRDHHLNISDVNAMSKVNNIVSNLKVGEKIIVQLDKNNRVTEMKIGSGGRFIRKANGSYIYK